jgi:hypothetical protein
MVAVVHYLSMNTPSGRFSDPAGTEYGGISYTYSGDSFKPSTGHTIDWGDSNTDTQASDSDGLLSHTHTYAVAGRYTIQIYETADLTRRVAKKTVTIAVKQGTLVVPGSIIENVAASWTGTGFNPNTAYSIDWGDLSSATTGTTNGSGAIGATNHTYATHGTYAVVVTVATESAATASAVVDYNDGSLAWSGGGSPVHTVSKTLLGTSFAFGRSYDIDWGDGGAHDTVTSDGTGAFSHAHTYALAGSVTVTIKDGSHTSATLAVTVS